jgi:hypothetical protein
MDVWSGETLECRNPALCTVCSTWWHLSGDEMEAIFDVSGLEMWVVMRPFVPELMRKWREKLANGTREPQRPGEKGWIVSESSTVFVPNEPNDS